MAEKHTKLLIRDAFLSTVFVFVCIAIFAFNPFNLKVFNIIGSSLKDIEVTDIIYSKKNTGKGDVQAKISKDIIVINAADRSRLEIAALIDSLSQEEPAVIGVDFIFEGPKDSLGDGVLKTVLENSPKVVLASKFKNSEIKAHKEVNTYISPSTTIGVHKEGYANLMIPSEDKTVRYIRTSDVANGKTIHPFALEVVRSFDSSKAETFIKRNKPYEVINYGGNLKSLYHFNGNDIISGNFPKGFLKGKIVLVGFFGSDCLANPVFEDNFYTPMNDKVVGRKFPDTYGVVIQANIINMILTENYIYKTPAWLDWMFGFVICFLHNFIFIRHYVHKHLWYHFYAKLIQLFTTFILVFFFIYLFKQFDIKLSASPFIVPVLLTVDLLYFYDTLVKWLHKTNKIKTYFLTGPLHH